MTLQEKAVFISRTLNKHFPDPRVPLEHKDAYTLLVAVILSARCTDAMVNRVTPALFKKADTPQKMAKLSVEEIRKIIRPCGLSPAKAKNIRAMSQLLIRRHGGKVPRDFAALEALPGVGHKTASVVMSQWFRKPAFPVDTHIQRLALRWGLCRSKNVKKIEESLKRAFPQKDWNLLHLQMIYFGRKYCPALRHDAKVCPICGVLNVL